MEWEVEVKRQLKISQWAHISARIALDAAITAGLAAIFRGLRDIQKAQTDKAWGNFDRIVKESGLSTEEIINLANWTALFDRGGSLAFNFAKALNPFGLDFGGGIAESVGEEYLENIVTDLPAATYAGYRAYKITHRIMEFQEERERMLQIDLFTADVIKALHAKKERELIRLTVHKAQKIIDEQKKWSLPEVYLWDSPKYFYPAHRNYITYKVRWKFSYHQARLHHSEVRKLDIKIEQIRAELRKLEKK